MPLTPTTMSNPLSKDEFHLALRRWLSTTSDAVVGDPSGPGNKPHVWVQHEGAMYKLNADTTRAGVQSYLSLVDQFGPDIRWTVVRSRAGTLTKVAFGDPPAILPGFYLYSAAALKIADLAAEADVTPRTIRYYAEEGLLPPPLSVTVQDRDSLSEPARRGQTAGTYSEEHLDRLRLIRQLQRLHQPLGEIRARITGLSHDEVIRLLREQDREEVAPPEASDARGYIARLRAAQGTTGVYDRAPGPAPRSDEAWKRITLSDGLELHYRMPISHSNEERLNTLLQRLDDYEAEQREDGS